LADVHPRYQVLSELRKQRRAHSRVYAWAVKVAVGELYVTATTIMEIEIGAQRLNRRNPKHGSVLRTWIDQLVLPTFAGRIFSFDTTSAQRRAPLHAPAPTGELRRALGSERRDALLVVGADEPCTSCVPRPAALYLTCNDERFRHECGRMSGLVVWRKQVQRYINELCFWTDHLVTGQGLWDCFFVSARAVSLRRLHRAAA
jgi:toxin FitB